MLPFIPYCQTESVNRFNTTRSGCPIQINNPTQPVINTYVCMVSTYAPQSLFLDPAAFRIHANDIPPTTTLILAILYSKDCIRRSTPPEAGLLFMTRSPLASPLSPLHISLHYYWDIYAPSHLVYYPITQELGKWMDSLAVLILLNNNNIST